MSEADRDILAPSPLPPPPPPSAHHRRIADSFPEGWVPANDDESARANRWRGIKALHEIAALRAADAQLAKSIDGLAASQTVLATTIAAWQAEGARRWTISGRLAWAVGVPLLVMVLAAIGVWVWGHLAWLHH